MIRVMANTTEKVEMVVTGKVYTRLLEGETKEAAQNRISAAMLRAEIAINVGDIRAHLSTHEYNGQTEICFDPS